MSRVFPKWIYLIRFTLPAGLQLSCQGFTHRVMARCRRKIPAESPSHRHRRAGHIQHDRSHQRCLPQVRIPLNADPVVGTEYTIDADNDGFTGVEIQGGDVETRPVVAQDYVSDSTHTCTVEFTDFEKGRKAAGMIACTLTQGPLSNNNSLGATVSIPSTEWVCDRWGYDAWVNASQALSELEQWRRFTSSAARDRARRLPGGAAGSGAEKERVHCLSSSSKPAHIRAQRLGQSGRYRVVESPALWDQSLP